MIEGKSNDVKTDESMKKWDEPEVIGWSYRKVVKGGGGIFERARRVRNSGV